MLLDSSDDAPSTSWDMTTVSKMDPTIARGVYQSSGFERETRQSGQNRLEELERGMK
jgi:hypothetical protein